MNARPATVDGHASLEAGKPPTKESYDSPYSVPWYRQKKWRIIMFVAAILVIGAVVGGAVGGTVASNNKGSKPNHGPSTVTLSSTTSSQGGSITGAPLDPTTSSTTNLGPPQVGSSSLPSPGTSTGAGVISTVGGNINIAFPTPTHGGTPDGGRQGIAPVVVWSE